MGKVDGFFTDKQLKQKTRKERKKLNEILNKMDEEQRMVCEPLVDNIVFCVVQLEELREILNRDGFYERYQNGKNQFGNKETIASKQYIKLGKLHSTLIKRLSDYLPEHSQMKDDLEKFKNKYDKKEGKK